MQKAASILDAPHSALDFNIFEKDEKLKVEVRDRILKKLYSYLSAIGLKNYSSWIKDIHLLGSLTSYQYTSQSDCDVHIYCSLTDINKIELNNQVSDLEQIQNEIDKVRKDLNIEFVEMLPGTSHPIEYSFITEFFGEGEKGGVYDILKDEWVVKPRVIEADFDIEATYPLFVSAAVELMNDMDLKISNIKRNVNTVEMLQEAYDSWSDEERKIFKEKIDARIKLIENEIQELIGKGKEVIDARRKYYKPFSEENIKFKFLQKYAYLTIVKRLEDFMKDKETLTEEEAIAVRDLVKQASYPKHPDKVKVHSIYGDLTEKDIFEHYMRHKPEILKDLEGYKVFLRIKTDGQLIIKRKEDEEYITLTEENFEKYITGSLELHKVVGETSIIGWCDLDDHREKSAIEDVKRWASKIGEFFRKNLEISRVEYRFSGGTGIYIIFYMKKEWDVNELREYLKDECNKLIDESSEITTSIVKDNMLRADFSTLKPLGSTRALQSINLETGLASIFITDINEFDIMDAKIKQTKISRLDLKEYKAKREFTKTPEPQPEISEKGAAQFVVQEHHTERNPKNPHFDFRLSVGGILKSWSIPKFMDVLEGKKDRVLAVETENHPYSYINFEGKIPSGEYGAGDVSIYCSGLYETLKRDSNKWTFKLEGKKVHGVFSLIKTDGKNWLLVKVKEKEASNTTEMPMNYLYRYNSPDQTLRSANDEDVDKRYSGVPDVLNIPLKILLEKINKKAVEAPSEEDIRLKWTMEPKRDEGLYMSDGSENGTESVKQYAVAPRKKSPLFDILKNLSKKKISKIDRKAFKELPASFALDEEEQRVTEEKAPLIRNWLKTNRAVLAVFSSAHFDKNVLDQFKIYFLRGWSPRVLPEHGVLVLPLLFDLNSIQDQRNLIHEISHVIDTLSFPIEELKDEMYYNSSNLNFEDWVSSPLEQKSIIREMQFLRNKGHSENEIIDLEHETFNIPKTFLKNLYYQSKFAGRISKIDRRAGYDVNKTISIDFDGVISLDAPYPDMGELMPDAKKTINELYNKGFYIIIHSHRLSHVDGYDQIKNFLDNNQIKYNRICLEKPAAIAYIDDKSYRFINWKLTNEFIENL